MGNYLYSKFFGEFMFLIHTMSHFGWVWCGSAQLFLLFIFFSATTQETEKEKKREKDFIIKSPELYVQLYNVHCTSNSVGMKSFSTGIPIRIVHYLGSDRITFECGILNIVECEWDKWLFEILKRTTTTFRGVSNEFLIQLKIVRWKMV